MKQDEVEETGRQFVSTKGMPGGREWTERVIERVSDKNGAAVVGARVNLDGEVVKGGTKSFSYRSKMTDSAGTYSFDDVGSKKHVITVYAMGFVTQEIQHQFHSSASEVNVVLSRP